MPHVVQVRQREGMHTPINPSLLANGPFSAAELERFRRSYRDQYGVTLNDDQVARYARAVVGYVALICRVCEPPAMTAADHVDDMCEERMPTAAGLDEVSLEFN